MTIEYHPLKPFLPIRARILMLGSFPPPRTRWSLDFFYPNYINDMWRVMGYVFYHDRLHFVDEAHRTFRLDLIVPFLEEKGIALYDTATAVRRLRDNASDKFLEILQPTDIAALANNLPLLKAVVTTGQKATDTFLKTINLQGEAITAPHIGSSTAFNLFGRTIRFYRMPSTSRAYPLSFEKKSARYAQMFHELGIL